MGTYKRRMQKAWLEARSGVTGVGVWEEWIGFSQKKMNNEFSRLKWSVFVNPEWIFLNLATICISVPPVQIQKDSFPFPRVI